MDSIAVISLVMSIISGVVLFIKGIKKCKCYKGQFEIERDINSDIEKQQEYTLRLIKALKTSYTPRRNDLNDRDDLLSSVDNKTLYKLPESIQRQDITDIIDELESEIENNKKNYDKNDSKHKKQNSFDIAIKGIKNLIKSKKQTDEYSPNSSTNDIRSNKEDLNKNISKFIIKPIENNISHLHSQEIEAPRKSSPYSEGSLNNTFEHSNGNNITSFISKKN